MSQETQGLNTAFIDPPEAVDISNMKFDNLFNVRDPTRKLLNEYPDRYREATYQYGKKLGRNIRLNEYPNQRNLNLK